MPLRIAFCGTPEFAVPSLRRLLADPEFIVEAVITQPDRPRGRGQEVSASPVKQVALEAGVQVHQPEKIKRDESVEFFTRLAVDAVVIIAYGQIISARLIAIPRLGWINLHGSLLPKYRGAAPINWAIANGETVTGLTTMQIDAGMDTGPMLLREEIEISPDETAPELANRMSEAGALLMAETLSKLARGVIAPVAQDSSLATYAPLLEKEHGKIDWTLPARHIYNRMRGFSPWPGAYSTFRGQTCQIWGRPPGLAASQGETPGTLRLTGDGVDVVCGAKSVLRLETVQLEGRKRLTARDFANGARLKPGECFGL